jgi:hypothetical protein
MTFNTFNKNRVLITLQVGEMHGKSMGKMVHCIILQVRLFRVTLHVCITIMIYIDDRWPVIDMCFG